MPEKKSRFDLRGWVADQQISPDRGSVFEGDPLAFRTGEVIGADPLRAAGEGLVAHGGIRRPGVGAGANEEAGLYETLDVFEAAFRIVALEPCGGGMPGIGGADEDQASFQRRVFLQVAVADCVGVVEAEDEFAAQGIEGRPAVGDHRLAQGFRVTADVIGKDDALPRDDGEDFALQFQQPFAGERFRLSGEGRMRAILALE